MRWKGKICSVCELFTSKDVAYIPVGRVVPSVGMKAVREYYENLGPKYVKALNEMIVFDALICNTDRHLGNFGVLINSKTNRIIRPAPIFDHANSLYNYAGIEDWQSEKALDEYAKTLLPCVCDDFFKEARAVLDKGLSEKVRKAVNFSFSDEGMIRYPKEKVELLEKRIRKNAMDILIECQ